MQSMFDSFSDATLRRLFKFVLKRSIGRFLRDELALEQVTVSSRNGILIIVDLDLDPVAINEELFVGSPIQLRRCTIKRLESAISYSSLLKDGFKTSLHGVDIELEPNTNATTTNTSTSTSAPSLSSSKECSISDGGGSNNPAAASNSINPTTNDDKSTGDVSGLGFHLYRCATATGPWCSKESPSKWLLARKLVLPAELVVVRTR